MALETASYVGGLVATNPTATDPKSQGDDHLRLIKAVLLNSFAGFSGMVIVTGSEAQGATANDYTVTVSPAPAAYTSPMLIAFKAAHANTGAATVQVNALGTKPLVNVDGVALSTGDIHNGDVVVALYDGTSAYLVSGNDRANRNGETYAGTHDFTNATPRVPTQAANDNSTKAASTAYVDAADALKAPIASPTLTGDPKAPTPAPGDNDTSIATTAFVQAALAFYATLASPIFTGDPRAPTPAPGDNDTSIATTAFVQAALAIYATLASPAFTGTPTAPTAAAGTNTNQIATTAFAVQLAFAAALPAQPGGTTPYTLTSLGGVAAWTSGGNDISNYAIGVI